jgi:hypothetical protein
MSETGRVDAGVGSSPDAARRGELLPCDLVMKGGITSGVVYPKLIGRLARDYQFKSIGGTSAGAIAAAGCAAAELGRQQGTNPGSFAQLAKLPDQLGEKIGAPPSSMLFHLFQPAASLRSHFAVLEGALNAPSVGAALAGALRSLLTQYWPLALLAAAAALAILTPAVKGTTALPLWPALGVAVTLLLAWLAALALAACCRHKGRALLVLLLAATLATAAAAHLLADAPWTLGALLGLACALGIPLAIGLGLGLVSWRFGATLLRGLHGNGYGLCSGRTEESRREASGLTDWLSEYFDSLAGRSPNDRPLTFGDLWGAPPDGPGLAADVTDPLPGDRLVNLEVVTSAVSQQMCYSIPFRDGVGAFYYDPAEWERLFPPRVMRWLAQASAPHSKFESPLETADGAVLRQLPSNRSLPVVVAVRMSLSFPLLLSAVPLFARDFSLGGALPEREIKRVWFSDGGISSNLPLHFFDAPLPGRPTFAVNLKEEHPAHPIVPDRKACAQDGRVYLPTTNSAGHTRYWAKPADETPMGLLGFLVSILDTMQNWRDEIQFPYPGYRDRIVQISQRPDEGGLNLKMPQANIDALSDAGECAGERLRERFHPDSTGRLRGGWENHEQIRLRTFLAVIEEMVTDPQVADTKWDRVVDRCRDENHYTRVEGDLALEVLRTVRDLGVRIKDRHASLQRKAPRPRATMRIAPRI